LFFLKLFVPLFYVLIQRAKESLLAKIPSKRQALPKPE
jgi:hypothetical protein